MPIPYLSNKPGPGRPGWGPAGSYDFQFRVEGQDAVVIKANAAGAGNFRISWPNGTTQVLSGNNASITAPDATDGIVSINNEELDTTYMDEFAVIGGKSVVREVISWGQNPWSNMQEAFDGCTSLSDIGTTSFIAGASCDQIRMFKGCTSLLEADIRNWNLTSGVSWYGGSPFRDLVNLQKLDMTGLNIKLVSRADNAFAGIGTAVADGCEFLMSGFNMSTSTATVTPYFFDGCRIKPTSDLSNWVFNPNGFQGTGMFRSAQLTGTNSTLNCSGWSTYSSSLFPNFMSMNSGAGDTGAKVDFTNLNVSNVNSLQTTFQSCELSGIIGLSTWEATAGNVSMYRAFYVAKYFKFSNSDNFSNAFIASLSPSNFAQAFHLCGSALSSNYGAAPNLNNIDLSNISSLSSTFESARFYDVPDLTTATFSSTAILFSKTFKALQTESPNPQIDFSNVSVKISNAREAFLSCKVNSVTFGNNVDFSTCTDVYRKFYQTNFPNTVNITYPTAESGLSWAALTQPLQWFTSTTGPTTGPLTTCQVDNLIRSFHNTALNSGLTVDFGLSKITEAPSVVRTLEAELVANGWTIGENATDATLPFAYASYIVDPTSATTISPTTTPPAGSVFTATNSLSINSSTGVITPGSFRGSSTIKCTYPDGCYNEVVMVLQVPFKMNITIPSGSTDFELKPQMSSGECLVDWGDTNVETLTGNTTHTYASSGSDQTYLVRIFDSSSGSKFTGFNSSWGATSGGYIDDIVQWGGTEWQNNSWFQNTSKLTITATDTPNLSQVTSLANMFASNGVNTVFSGGSAISNWDVSNITAMNSMFYKIGSSNFTQDLSDWDVSNVITLSKFNYTHPESTIYNQNWKADWGNKTAKVEDFSEFMYGGKSNNIALSSNIGNYNTSSATNMSYMFFNNGGFANCKTKKLNAGQANEYIAWDVKKVANFSYMFAGGNGSFVSTEFPDNWYISGDGQDINMQNMLGWQSGATSMDNVTDLNSFATKTIASNVSPYGTQYTAWNMSNTTNLSGFNQNSSANVRNWNISSWQISNKLTTFDNLFSRYENNSSWTYSLDQDLGHWDIANVTNATDSWRNTYATIPTPSGYSVNFSTANYDSLLDITNGWGQHAGNAQSGVALNMGSSSYTATNVVQGTCNNTGTNNTNCNDYGNAPFVTAGVQVGDIAYNVTTGQYSKVLSVVFTGTGITTDQAIWSNGDIYRVERSDAVKGKYALIDAGWTITDGGLYVPPITPLKFDVNVTTTTTNANLEFKIPFITGTNFSIKWGDGNTDTGLSVGNSSVTHTYSSAGTYSIEIGQPGDASPPTKIAFGPTNGEVNNSSTPGSGAKAVTEITQWGSIQWTDVVSMWCGCLNLDTISATDTPDLSNVGGISGTKFMFGAMRLRDGFDAPSLSTVNSSINNWDVSSIKSFSYMFQRCNSFNASINDWDISGIDQANGLIFMFNGARLFNQSLSNWTLPPAVTSLAGMFRAHDTTNGFNQNVGHWNVSNITNMSKMFESNGAYTGIGLENWERTTPGNTSTVGNVTNMSNMFFYGYGLANTAISNWDTSKVTNFASMFGRWGFPTASNPQIDVGNIVKYWDTSSATNFDSFFTENRAINQNLGSLDITSLTRGIGMFYRSNLMSDANYTDTIVGWANFVKNQTPDAPLNVLFSNQQQVSFESARSGGANFTNAAEARTFLTDSVSSGGAGWTINGDTIIPLPFNPFQMEFDTSGGKTITIPNTVGSSFTVDWGDGNTTTETGGTISHTYGSGIATSTVSIGAQGDTGPFTTFAFANSGSKSDLIDIPQWGSIAWSSMISMFRGCNNSSFTTISATDIPNLSSVTSIAAMFRSCTNLASINNFNSWDVSNVTSLFETFRSATSFNQNLNSWDVSNVTNMQEAFSGASSFNGNISSWNVGNVTAMSEMFLNATPFNQDISGWNVGVVENMLSMFNGCSSFNQNISSWNVGSVLSMSSMFNGCSAFNQDISGWNVGNVTTMASMFNGATVFNADISSWDTSDVTSMGYMFRSANAFNQDISGWDVSKVTSFSRMFNPATSLNQNLGAWNLRTAGTVMSKVFAGSTSMSEANYTDTIVEWANYVYANSAPYTVNMGSQTNMTFDRARSGGANFTDAGAARDYLTGATANWTITGDTEIN